jgi:hypothetical protein
MALVTNRRVAAFSQRPVAVTVTEPARLPAVHCLIVSGGSDGPHRAIGTQRQGGGEVFIDESYWVYRDSQRTSSPTAEPAEFFARPPHIASAPPALMSLGRPARYPFWSSSVRNTLCDLESKEDAR